MSKHLKLAVVDRHHVIHFVQWAFFVFRISSLLLGETFFPQQL